MNKKNDNEIKSDLLELLQERIYHARREGSKMNILKIKYRKDPKALKMMIDMSKSNLAILNSFEDDLKRIDKA
tara:strand:+ start:417 stop:635 length:219 start_codon:yes stop_codon:yes gene_type:complete